MSEVGVYLGGEGNNELGSRCGDPIYQNDSKPGVVETLLRAVQPCGWNVVGAMKWCRIRKLQAKGQTPGDRRNVLGLVHEAKRARAQVLAFVRDADGDRDRTRAIEAGIREARKSFPDVEIVGGTAIPVLEAWILAMHGEQNTEGLSKAAAQAKLVQKHIDPKNTDAMVEVATKVVPARLPEDATSLKTWLATASEILPRLVRTNT